MAAFDRNNELLKLQQSQASNQYLRENEEDPNALMNLLQANIQGNATPDEGVQIPFVPEETSNQTSIPENYNDMLSTEALELGLNQEIPEDLPQTPPTQPLVDQTTQLTQSAPSREEEILRRFKEMRDANNLAISEAQERDRRNALSDTIMRGSSKIANAFANRSGHTKIDNKPISLTSNETATAQALSKRNLEDLMSEYKLISDMNKAKVDERYKQEMLDLQKQKLAQKSEKEKQPSYEEKEQIKEDAKVRTENRKERKNIEKDLTSTENLLKDLEKTEKLFKEYSKKTIGGTGPLATIGGLTKYGSEKAENLDAQFKKMNLDTMVKMFNGMSRAVDSDRERAAFEAAQPSLTNDDNTNARLIAERIAAAKSLLRKQKEALSSIDKQGNFVEPDIEPETKNIGGRSYRKVEGGWELVE